MWRCKTCGETTDDDAWECCWKCSRPNPNIAPADHDAPTIPPAEPGPEPDTIDNDGESDDLAGAPIIELSATQPETIPEERQRGYEDEYEKDRLARFMICNRCGESLRFLGRAETTDANLRHPWLRDLGEALTEPQDIDRYFCSDCGNIELFVSGFGRS